MTIAPLRLDAHRGRGQIARRRLARKEEFVVAVQVRATIGGSAHAASPIAVLIALGNRTRIGWRRIDELGAQVQFAGIHVHLCSGQPQDGYRRVAVTIRYGRIQKRINCVIVTQQKRAKRRG